MADILATFGTIGGYTVTLQRRFRQPGDPNASPQASQVQALTLTKGASVTEIATVEDTNPPEANTSLVDQGKAVIAAFAAIGAQVTLGDPSSPVASSVNAAGPYARAIDLVPGTPVQPGRAARIFGGGSAVFGLKFAGGGILPASDASGGSGTIIDRVAVVDANVPTGGKVQILY